MVKVNISANCVLKLFFKKIKNNMRKPNIINFTVTFVTMLATEITNEDTQGQSIKE